MVSYIMYVSESSEYTVWRGNMPELLVAPQIHLSTNDMIKRGRIFNICICFPVKNTFSLLVCSMRTPHEESISSIKLSFVAQRHW